MSGIGWEETLPVELWMDPETGQVTAVVALPRDRWLKALELGLDRERGLRSVSGKPQRGE